MNQRVNTHNKSIKPWFDKNEWKRVYELLFGMGDSTSSSTACQTHQALLHLNVWKSRVDLLPSAIEGTVIILEALSRNNATYTDMQLREAHSFSILRFLNVCVTSRTRQGSFKATAISQNIPSWIIEIRNDISHDQKLPSLVCLKAALRACFQWLKTRYWDAEYEAKKDFIPKPIDTRKVEALVQVYFIVLTPDYNHEYVVDILTKVGVEAPLTRRNLKDVILAEIELSMPIPYDSAKILCNIIINTFLTRYLTDKTNQQKVAPNKLDDIIIFLYENKMLHIFIEILLNLNKRYYPEHVLYFYSKILERIFTTLYHLQIMKPQGSLIQFRTPNIMKLIELHKLYEFEIYKATPNIFSSSYMESFSKLFNHNMNYSSSITPVMVLQSISTHALETQIYSKDIEDNYASIFEKSNNIKVDVEPNQEGYRTNTHSSEKNWSIVEDTSIFQKCALGDYPAVFLETAADALYNYIK